MIYFCLSCGVKQPDRLGSAGAAPPLPAARLRVRGRGVTGCQPECQRSVGVPGPGPSVCRARHRGHDRPLNLTGILRLKLDSDVSSSFESAAGPGLGRGDQARQPRHQWHHQPVTIIVSNRGCQGHTHRASDAGCGRGGVTSLSHQSPSL
jgi:hypothetical protein